MPTGIDPRYDDYKPQEEITMCMCCQNEEATQYWLTLNGRLRMCDDCVNSPDKDDNFLIDKL